MTEVCRAPRASVYVVTGPAFVSVGQLVGHLLWEQENAGSSPVTRTLPRLTALRWAGAGPSFLS